MDLRPLGRTDLRVSAITLGCMALRATDAPASESERIRAIHAALDAGINALDTAPLYELGRAERIVGRAIAGRRDQVVLLTKVGLRWDDGRGGGHFPVVDASGERRMVRRNSRPDSIRLEVERSLERLGVDVLDLVQVHQRDEETPIAETMGALLALRCEGKIRAIGVSNFTASDLALTVRALGDVPLASVQPRLNLLQRQAEVDILPFARARGIGVLVYSPLRQGLLTGQLDPGRIFPEGDFRHGLPDFSPENRARVNAVLRQVAGPIAERHRASIAEVTLAWTLAQAGVTSAIVGARTPDQAAANARAASIALSGLEVLALRQAFEALAPRKSRRSFRDFLASMRRRIRRR